MSWFITAFVATFFFILYDILARVLSVKSKNPRAFSIVYNSFCSLIVLSFLFFEKWSFKPITFRVVWLTFIATVLWSIFNRVEFYAHKHMELSVRPIIGNLAPLTTFFATALFLKEDITPGKILAAALILGGNVFVLYRRGESIKSKGLIYALITSISLGLAWTMDKKVSAFYPTSFYVLLVGYLIPTLYVWAIPPLSLEVIREEFRLASWKLITLALFNVLGYYTLIKAFAIGEASKITLIISAKSVFTVLSGIIILKERTNVVKKIVAGIIATVGVLLLK